MEDYQNRDIKLEKMSLDIFGINVVWEIFDFSEAWEKEYRNRSNNGWDIAQVIQTAMQEALYEVREILEWADVLTFEHVEKHRMCFQLSKAVNVCT